MNCLVKDLSVEMKPFLLGIVETVIKCLLRSMDPEVIEASFICLVHVFQFAYKEKEYDFCVSALKLFFPIYELNSKTFLQDLASQTIGSFLILEDEQVLARIFQFLLVEAASLSVGVLLQLLKTRGSKSKNLSSLLESVIIFCLNEQFDTVCDLIERLGNELKAESLLLLGNCIGRILQKGNIDEIKKDKFLFFILSNSKINNLDPFGYLLTKSSFQDSGPLLAQCFLREEADACVSKGRKLLNQLRDRNEIYTLLQVFHELASCQYKLLQFAVVPYLTPLFPLMLQADPYKSLELLTALVSCKAVQRSFPGKFESILLEMYTLADLKLKFLICKCLPSSILDEMVNKDIEQGIEQKSAIQDLLFAAVEKLDKSADCAAWEPLMSKFVFEYDASSFLYPLNEFYKKFSGCLLSGNLAKIVSQKLVPFLLVCNDQERKIAIEILRMNYIKMDDHNDNHYLDTSASENIFNSKFMNLLLLLCVPITLENYRDKIVSLMSLEACFEQLDDEYRPIYFAFLLGFINVKFSPIWPAAFKTLGNAAMKDHFNFWGLVQTQVELRSLNEQLLKFFNEFPSIAERENAFFVSFYFDGNQKSIELLSLFSKFKSASTIYRTADLFASFMEHLCNGDAALQEKALDCILIYKNAVLIQNKDILYNLIKDKQFREDLVKLQSYTMDAAFKSALMPVVLRILFGRITTRKRKSNSQNSLESKRKAVIKFIGCFGQEEADYFINLGIEKMGIYKKEKWDANIIISDDSGSFYKNISGFLHLCGGFILILGHKMSFSRLNLIIELITNVYKFQDKNESESNELKELKLLATKRLVDLFKKELFPVEAEEIQYAKKEASAASISTEESTQSSIENFSENGKIDSLFQYFIHPTLSRFVSDFSQSSSYILDLLFEWSCSEKYKYLMFKSARILSVLIETLEKEKTNESVVFKIAQIILNLLQYKVEISNDFHFKLVKSIEKLIQRTNDKRLLKLAFEIIQLVFDGNANETGCCDAPRLYGPISPSALNTDFTKQRTLFSTTDSNLLPCNAFSASDAASSLALILLSFLKKPSKLVCHESKYSILLSLSFIIPHLLNSTELTSQATWTLSSFLLQVEEQKLVELVAHNLSMLVGSDSVSAQLIKKLNSFEEKRVNDPNFDAQISALISIQKGEFELKWYVPVTFCIIKCLRNEGEMAIRSAASAALFRIIQEMQPSGIQAMDIEVNKQQSTETVISISSAASWKNLIDIIMAAIKDGLGSKVLVIRQEFIGVLAFLVQNCSNMQKFDSLKPLLSADPENNFFLNISHLQLHRKIRALHSLAEYCNQIKQQNTNAIIIPNSLIVDILIPIASQFITESDKVADHNIINEAISCIASLTSLLNYGKYFFILRKFLRLLKKMKEREKILLRLVVAILEKFDLSFLSMSCNLKSRCLESLDGEKDESECAFPTNLKSVDSFINDDTLSLVKRHVSDFIIPELYKYFTKQDAEKVVIRSPVAVAIVSVLKQMPKEIMNRHIPKLITTLAQLLRSRLQDARDAARSTLVSIAEMLGIEYFCFILKELRDALGRGYQLHVLGYTVHSLLYSISKNRKIFSDEARKEENISIWKEAIPLILSILMNQVFGSVMEEKEAEEFSSKMKEVKAMKAFDAFELLASFIEPSLISLVIDFIQQEVDSHFDSKSLRNFIIILQKIAIGVGANSEFSYQKIFLLIYPILSGSQKIKASYAADANDRNKIGHLQAVSLMEKTFLMDETKSDKKKIKEDWSFIFIEFSLKLLLSAIKDFKGSFTNEYLSMLDPFCSILVELSKHSVQSVSILAMKCISRIASIPLNSVEEACSSLFPFLLKQTVKFSSLESENSQAVFKAIASILKNILSVTIGQEEVKFIIEIILLNLNLAEGQSSSFSMARVLIGRRIFIPEIYDLMDRFTSLMISSHSEATRSAARQTWLEFLLDYPIGKKRLGKQMNFLVSNLSYQFEEGRLSVLEVFMAVVKKFPLKVLNEFIEMFFMSVICRMVNEDSLLCKEKLIEIASCLVERSEEQQKLLFTKLAEKWILKNELFMAGMYSVSILHKCGVIFETKFKNNLEQSLVRNIESMRLNSENDDELKELINIFSTFFDSSEFDKVWLKLQDILLNENKAVSAAALTSFSLLFRYLDENTLSFVTKEFVHGISKIFIRILIQFSKNDESFQDSLTRCLVSCCKYFAFNQENSILFFTVQHIYKAAKMLTFPYEKAIVAMKVFGVVAVVSDDSQFTNVSEYILKLAYLSSELFLQSCTENVKKMGLELLEVAKCKMTDAQFYEAIGHIRDKQDKKKKERKQKLAIMAVADQQLASELKLKRNLVKRVKRQEKSKKRKTIQ